MQDKLIAYQALIKAFIFTLLMLAVFQLGTHLTLPGLELKSSSSADSTSPMSLLSMFGGGGSKYFSIFLLGVSPYITASIIINVLCSGLIPSLSKKIKNSKNAKTIMEKMIYVLAIPLAILQGLLFIASSNNPNLIKLFTRNNPNLSHKYDFYLALLIIFLIFGTCFAV